MLLPQGGNQAPDDGGVPLRPQAYFSYDAHKSGGVTVSHLRFGPQPIRAPWLVDMAHYLGVHQQQYWAK